MYPSINGLRAISILLVLVHHLSIKNHLFQELFKVKWLRPVIEFISDGPLGVNVFFVLSGFLITTLLLKEETISNKISLKKFYIRRTLRIFPAYYFLLLVYFILELLNIIHISNASWITAITYTKYFNWNLDWITAHAWTLSVEEHFYLFWPLIFIMSKKYRAPFAFSLIIIVPIIRTLAYHFPVEWINDLSIFTRIDAIATGCVFALFNKKIVTVINNYWTSLIWISFSVLFLLRYFPVLFDKVYPGLSMLFIPLGLTFGTIANLLIALIIMYAIFGPKNIFYKTLNSALLNYIGLLSYSLYLWQQIFISGDKNWINLFPQNLILLIGMSLFSYYIIEKPFLKLKRKFHY